MVGYTFAIFSSVVTSTLLMTKGMFDKIDGEWQLKKIMMLYPSFPFNRIMYLFVDGCSFEGCVTQMSFVTPELWMCCYMVYFDAILYFIIAVYLQEVMP
jgi:hypothetical protein